MITASATPPRRLSSASPIRNAPLIGLIGNPNTGKSTIFNRLTGLRQRIANYPGITVEARVGNYEFEGRQFDVLDLPGAYSLSASSPEERVTIDLLTGHAGARAPDVIVCVLDATNLKRNLFLASQLAEFDKPAILVLNQWDEAAKLAPPIDPAALEAELGTPVLTTVGTRGEGLIPLRKAIAAAINSPRRMTRITWRPEVLEAGREVQEAVSASGESLTLAEAHRMIFDCQSAIRNRLSLPEERLDELIRAARNKIRHSGLNPSAAEAVLHYEHMDGILARALQSHLHRTPSNPVDASIDALLVHRLWGSLIFLAVMWVVFQSVYSWAGPLMDIIDGLTGATQDAVGPMLAATPIFQSLIVDGVIAGVGGVLIFLPQIFLLFLFIALLEESGYMARGAFLMDKLFGWCGLNGKSFVPLLSSFACAIPGIMAARSLEDPRARLTTVLMAPFMSCSARLPVYVLLIGVFIEPRYGAFVAGLTLFAMHFVGLAVSLPLAWVFNRFILRTPPMPFILEMTRYRIPDSRNVLMKMWEGGREFVVRAGTVILAFSVVIWALLYFPRDNATGQRAVQTFIQMQSAATGETTASIEAGLAREEVAVALEGHIEGAYLEDSYLGRFGKFVQPMFAPAGFDWKITVGVLSSFPAREVIIATMGIIYNLGSEVDEESEGLRGAMASAVWKSGPLEGRAVYSLPVVFALMVFFALCMQCGATVAVIAKQLNWRWAAASFVSMTLFAWIAAVAIYQIGSRLPLL